MVLKVFNKTAIIETLARIQQKAKSNPNLIIYFIGPSRQRHLFSNFIVENDCIRLIYSHADNATKHLEIKLNTLIDKSYDFFDANDSLTIRGTDSNDEFFSIALRDKNYFN